METVDKRKTQKKVDVTSMSERQSILFLEKGGGKLLSNSSKEPRNILLDYHKYYLFQKKQNEQKISKEKLERRRYLTQLSQKEYNQIKKNQYMDRKRINLTDEGDYQCSCVPIKFTKSEENEILQNHYKDKTEEELFGCGKGKCINKMVFIECDENCPCGVSCRNRKFQNHEYADVYPIKTEDRGWGLCAGSFLPKDTFVMQYIGEIYSLDSEYGQKKMEEYKNRTCTYLMGLPNSNRHEVIDPTKHGNMARFINHSCDPNCETRKWHVRGELCIGIFTKKDIEEDEELTFNYDFDLCKTRYQKCLCGASNCRGYLGISTEQNKKKLNGNLNCDICKEHCRHNDSIIDCKICGKFFHKKCAKKKGELSIKNEYKCEHCSKKGYSKKDDTINLKEKIRLDEEPIYDEIYEVGDEDLQKIKKNLGELINIGAMLFWDFQSENAILGTSNKIDLKISGTTKQIEGVKEAIKKLKLKKEEGTTEYTTKLNIPKIYIRKIIGHQHRNLDSYKSKFDVQILYDYSLITDEIFPLQEITTIEIKGKESNVKAVALNIKKYLFNLRVISIYLLQEDYYYLRQNICSLKTSVDPADLRLRKLDTKNEREIKHPFYYISNNIKDIVIIGFENEISKAKVIIKNSILRQNNVAFNYSLSFLFPIYFKSKLYDFISENKKEINDNKLRIEHIDPEYLRRHISVTISGKWDSIVQIKKKLWKYLKNYAIDGVPKKHDINEFEQYAYNQENKLISKSIRTYIIEQSPQIKNWDYISEDIEYLQDKYYNHLSQNNKLIGQSSPDRKKESQDIVENFIYTSDKETRINYLINMRPGSYKKVFKMSQNDLFNDMIGVIDETYNSYKESKLVNDNLSVNENKSEDFGLKDKNKIFKYPRDENFIERERINSSLFHSDWGETNNYKKNEEMSNSNYNSLNNNIINNHNFGKYLENQNILSNNPLSNLSNDKKGNNINSINNMTDSSYNNYEINNSSINQDNKQATSSNINSFPQKYSSYTKANYSSEKMRNYQNNYSINDNDSLSCSSYLKRKTNRVYSKSSSEGRKDNINYHHKKENNRNYEYDDRRYSKYYDKYDDRYDKRKSIDKKSRSNHDNHRKNSPYNNYKDRSLSYYYDDYNYNNLSNDYSIKYNNRENKDNRDRGRRSNSVSSKKYDNNYKEYNNEYSNNGYSNIEHKGGYSRSLYKDNYRIYSQPNLDYSENYSKNYMNSKESDYNNYNNNNNRFTSSNYNRSYYNRKRMFDDNKYVDKRKGGYKGNSSNYISGNKYCDHSKQERSRSRSRSRNRRSRSRSWSRRSSRSRRDSFKRSYSNSLHKFNDNFE